MGWSSMRRGALVTATAFLALAAVGGAQQGAEVPAPAATAPGTAEGTPVPVSVLAVAFPIPGATDAQVPVIVEVGGPQLVAGHGDGLVEGEIRAVATDAAGRAVQQIVQPFVLGSGDETLQRTWLKLYATMRLPAGDYRLRATATNAQTGAAGAWDGDLHVPDFAAGALAMSPPLFPESADRWRVRCVTQISTVAVVRTAAVSTQGEDWT